MSDLVNSVLEKVPGNCRAKSCSAKRCSVVLSNELRPRVVIDLDRCEELVSKSDTRCDYIVFSKFCGDDWVVPLELSTGKKRASEIVSQLQAGASIAEGIVCNGVSVKFLPVFAHRGIKIHEMKTLRTKRVKFRQKSEIIRIIRCGSKLIQAL